jgi:hypothetical protein
MRSTAALTLALLPGLALAYPGATAVSLGSNPVFSHGGNMGVEAESTTVFTAPADQVQVITDVSLGITQTSRSCELSVTVRLKNDLDEVLAEFAIGMPDLYNHPGNTQGYHFVSGLAVNPGQSLVIETERSYRECDASSYRLRYTLAGYRAQP